jgi:hypothetical protein
VRPFWNYQTVSLREFSEVRGSKRGTDMGMRAPVSLADSPTRPI